MDMGGGMGSGSMSMGNSMSGMSMVFANNIMTSLYSLAWTPMNSSTYAGTCIFLIILAIISRLMFAGHHALELYWFNRAVSLRSTVIMKVKRDPAEEGNGRTSQLRNDSGLEAEKGEIPRLKFSSTPKVMPWRFSVDLPRACIFTVHAGVGYLLMLAVMTMNIGYFLSVLAGFFVGELFVGRFMALSYHGTSDGTC